MSVSNSPVADRLWLYSGIQRNLRCSWMWNQSNVTLSGSVYCRVTVNKSLIRSHAQPKTTTSSGDVGLQYIVSPVRPVVLNLFYITPPLSNCPLFQVPWLQTSCKSKCIYW